MAGEVRVRIMSNGLCEECEHERAWDNKEEMKRQRDKLTRLHMMKKAGDIVNRKWKEKYGDASVEEVASYL
tara:strand:- start:616 stop:828 length:213 start_codon:yes stop_codon:yes gene_type:complete